MQALTNMALSTATAFDLRHVRTTPDPVTARPVLLIGHDEVFAQSVKHAAVNRGVQVVHRQGIFDLVPGLKPARFGVAIVDCQQPEGMEAAYFIDQWAPKLPVLLIGGHRLWVTSKLALPYCVRDFQPKSTGANVILEDALAMLTRRPS
jgi:ActR/RegA family two-component response regulator